MQSQHKLNKHKLEMQTISSSQAQTLTGGYSGGHWWGTIDPGYSPEVPEFPTVEGFPTHKEVYPSPTLGDLVDMWKSLR